jgi:hypothetical protein
MATVASLESFKEDYEKREQRQSEVAQAKFTPSEMERLDDLVQWLSDRGANATRSGVVRALVMNGLDVYREEIAKG